MKASLSSRLGAEFLGTFWLVFGGCGTALIGAVMINNKTGSPFNIGVGHLGVALAFGLTVVTMAYAVGHVSGAHFNPAVTVGLATAKRFAWKDVPAYVITQVIAASVAGAVLWLIVTNQKGADSKALHASGFASNGYDAHSPNNYTLVACLLIEVVLTMFFMYVILGVTDGRAPVGFAPLAIGLALTLIHLISIPVTNTSVNPARSTGVAWFGDGALGQLWLFWLAPLVGAVIAGLTYSVITSERTFKDLVDDLADNVDDTVKSKKVKKSKK